ncbi:MAG: sulfatase-like hydrolase/transferase [Leptospiraceae bacterium]|nr:sulfatase-like hydrolase/transferase [Leptospiraceae bacterium]MCP5494163.1 sulfatase-like hydrolase/transferase [Leptospiraceae bacterium]
MKNKIINYLKKIFFSYNFKFFGTLFLLCIPIFTLYRIIFFLKYAYRIDFREIHYSKILMAFVEGLRFDISSICIVFGFLFILSCIDFLNRKKLYVFFWSFTPILLVVFIVAILIADILYFEHANKHIGYEAYVFLGKDLILIVNSLLEENKFVFFGGVLVLAVLTFTSFRVYQRYHNYSHLETSFFSSLIKVLIAFSFVAVGVRGGLQNNPIRTSNAIISNNTMVNNLALNGVYTAIVDLKSHSVSRSDKMDFKEAIAIVRKEISYKGATFVSEEYPLLRKTIPKNKDAKNPNIVLVMLENWTGKFINPITDGKVNGKEVAPYFNKLLKEGIFFKRFFASGGRTPNGMMSLLTGIPDRPGLTVVRTPQAMVFFSGIGSIMRQANYRTFFVTGGDLSFDNKHKMMPHWGFDESIGKQDLDRMNRYSLGAWGYDDADVFDVLHNKLKSLEGDRPFFATVLTLTTHYPYRTPKEEFNIFGKESADNEFLNVYHYADWALQSFLEKARQAPYFDNTIFIFVADHTHHRFLDYYEDRNIPFLIYSPSRFKPEIRNDIASQLDVIPTIIGNVNKEIYFSAMGRDLLNTKTNSAYFAYGTVFGWVEDQLFLFRTSDGAGGVNFTVDPPHIQFDICKKAPLFCKSHHKKAKAYLNTSIELMNQNLVFPASLKEFLDKRQGVQ